MDTTYILTHDVGTTGNKACIYRITDCITLIDSHIAEYPLYTLPNGGVEQKADEWWHSVCVATKSVLGKSGVRADQISGMAFCAQMQGLVMVDREGNALRNPMSYLDGRSTAQIDKHLNHGLVKIDGKYNLRKGLQSLYVTGGLAATAKDPLWKYHWVRENEPEIFEKTYKWLDVKDYLNMRCTGEATMTLDSAHITFIYDTRPGKLGWNKALCRLFNVNMDHLPRVIEATDIVGHLTEKAAREMGLVKGIPVFGGVGDVAGISIGSGCLDLYDTHVYTGTSGWVSSNVDKRMVDIGHFIASILGAIPGRYNYTAEQETSGVCMQWFRDHLALDEIGIYLEKQHVCDKETEFASLYDFLSHVIKETPPGAGNVLFTPWLHGNRAPKEDPYARGMFFNLGLQTGKRQLVRSVIEGIAFHKRWLLEAMELKIPKQERVRFVGGGAKSDATCQILADITGRTVETIANTQNAGTIGATTVCAVGLGIFSNFEEAKCYIPVEHTYTPRKQYRGLYDKNFEIFKKLYSNNKKIFRELNRQTVEQPSGTIVHADV